MTSGARPDRLGPPATPAKDQGSLVGFGQAPARLGESHSLRQLRPLIPREAAIYWVYILRSGRDARLYTGVTSNLPRRLREHNAGKVHSTDPTGRVQRAQPFAGGFRGCPPETLKPSGG